MPNRKISELTLATSSLPTDGLVIQRGASNFKLEASNFSTDGGDTGSLVTTSSITGTTQTFTKGDGSTYTNEIVSASHAEFAISASYAVTSSHEVVYETSASYANTATSASHAERADDAISASFATSASMAQLALEAISSSYAISASHAEVSDEAISASYALTASHATSTAGTLSNGTSVDAFSFDGSTDVTVDISTYSASVSTDRTNLSASLTTTDQTISSSVANLSGSASDARNQLAADYIAADTALSSSLTTTDQTISASVASLSGSASDARNQLATDYIAADTALSASLTTTDQTISASVATLSGSASDARNQLKTDLTVSGTDGQTIRYEGTTQVANSVLFNSGSQVSIGNTSPKAGYSLTVTNQDDAGDHRMLVGRTDAVGGTQDYLELRSTGTVGYLEARNDLMISASHDGNTADITVRTNRNIILSASNGAVYNASNQIKDLADPTDNQDAVTKNYTDSLVVGQFVSKSGDTMTDTLTINKSGDSVDDADLPLGIIGSGLIVGDQIGDTRTFTNGTVVQFRDYGEAHWRLMNSASQFTIEQNSGGGNDGAYITFPKLGKDLTFAGKLQNVSDPVAPQDAVTKAYLESTTGSYVLSVNGNGPDGAGNVAVSLASTSTGLSSSFPASPDDADVYIISGETATDRTASNGEIFIYSTASSQWYQITSPDQTANDERYVLISGDTMTGRLVINNNTDFGLDVERPSGNEPGISFIQQGIARTILHQNLASPYGLSITDSGKVALRPIHVADPTIGEQAATKNYVDSNFVELSGDTMSGNLTIANGAPLIILNDNADVNGAAYIRFQGNGSTTGEVGMVSSTTDDIWLRATRSNGNAIIETEGSGQVQLRGGDFVASTLTRINGSGGCTMEFENTAGDTVQLGLADDGKGWFAGNGQFEWNNTRLIEVTDPVNAQDAATKNYVDGLLSSTITAAVWDSSATQQTQNGATKITFNLNSSRQTSTNDSSQASWNTTNHEFVLGEGTWHIVFDYRKDENVGGSTSATRFFQTKSNTTAGGGVNSGTLIDAAPTKWNDTAGEKIHMEAFLTVPASSTRYVFFANVTSGVNTLGRFQKAICRRIA